MGHIIFHRLEMRFLIYADTIVIKRKAYIDMGEKVRIYYHEVTKAELLKIGSVEIVKENTKEKINH